MRTLYLLRHAKSDWSDLGLADHDRPLAPRGRKAARRMGRVVTDLQPQPSVVLCSSAKRARDTWHELGASLSEPYEFKVEEGLYGASAVDLLARIRRLPQTAGAALLIGHNPGIQDLAIDLAGDGDRISMSELLVKFPTCALAAMSLEAAWQDVAPGSGYLTSLVIPKRLPE